MTYKEVIEDFKVAIELMPDEMLAKKQFELAVTAMEKQIPKKPIYEEDNKAWYCGECKRFVWVVQKHCEHCGQAIDWSDYK